MLEDRDLCFTALVDSINNDNSRDYSEILILKVQKSIIRGRIILLSPSHCYLVHPFINSESRVTCCENERRNFVHRLNNIKEYQQK